MNQEKLDKKITLGVRLSGWLCLLPASALLFFYQQYHVSIFMWDLVLVVLFAAFTLTTAPTSRWRNMSYVLGQMFFAIFFIAVIPAIPLLFVYLSERKAQKNK